MNDGWQTLVYKPFAHAVQALRQTDGAGTSAALSAAEAQLAQWSAGGEDMLLPRPPIDGPALVRSYGLSGGVTLLVWQLVDLRVPLYIGWDANAEQWGIDHRDHAFHFDPETKEVAFTRTDGASRDRSDGLPPIAAHAPFAMVPPSVLDALAVPGPTALALRALIAPARQNAPEALVLLAAVRLPGPRTALALAEALALLAADRREEALTGLTPSRVSALEAPEEGDRLNLFDAQLKLLRPPHLDRSIFARRGDQYFSTLGLSPAAQWALAAWISPANPTARPARALLNALDVPSEAVRSALHDALDELGGHRYESARARLRLAAGGSVLADRDPTGFAAAIGSGRNTDQIVPMRALEKEEVLHVLRSPDFADWMLYLHPDQMAIVEREFNGSARLVGVAGSGKTSVLIHRARWLALKYPGQAILVLTLNRSLVRLIEALLDRRCEPHLRPQIEVEAMYDYCHRAAVAGIQNPRTVAELRQVGILTRRQIDTMWEDFAAKPHAQEHFKPFIEALATRADAVDAVAYLRDELRWVRSGYGKLNRRDYLAAERKGRTIGLPRIGRTEAAAWAVENTHLVLGQTLQSGGLGRRDNIAAPAKTSGMPADARLRVLRLLTDWEEFMDQGAEHDDEGVAQLAYEVRTRILAQPRLRARCVLIDEAQDFSTLELAVAAQIPSARENGLFLCADPVQRILPKQQDLSRAGISLRGRGIQLRVNYRNTRRILLAAFRLIEAFADQMDADPADILQPEFALRDGSAPVLYECQNREQEINLVLAAIEGKSPMTLTGVCVVTPCSETRRALAAQLRRRGTPFVDLDENVHLGPGLRVSDLDQVKGHEFEQVFLLDMSDALLPFRGRPWEERWRDALRIYVAMTRAREDLSLAFIHNRTELLRGLQDTVEEVDAASVLP